MLRYDDGRRAAWTADGLDWQAVFLHWNPAAPSKRYWQGHTPDVCLTAIGNDTTRIAGRVWFQAAGLRLPFAVYAVGNTPKPAYVYYCLWNDLLSSHLREKLPAAWADRLIPVLVGVRNPGHRSLEISLSGLADEAQAGTALENQLQKIIRRGP